MEMICTQENRKNNEPHKFVLNSSQRLDLRNSSKHVALQNLSVYYTLKNIRQQYENNKLEMITPTCRSSRPKEFLGKGALKICSKFTGGHPCRSTISIMLLCIFIELYFGMGVLL